MLAEWVAADDRIWPSTAHLEKDGLATLVVEEDGVPVLAVPFYHLWACAFLAYAPETTSLQRAKAMKAGLEQMEILARQKGVRQILGFPLDVTCPIAAWGDGHGFKRKEASVYDVAGEVKQDE